MKKVLQFSQSKNIRTLAESVVNQSEIFRQKRIDNSSGHLNLTIGQETYKLANWSRTGLAFEVEGKASFPVGLKVGPTKIFVGPIQVYEGDIEIKSLREDKNGKTQVGAEFKGKLFVADGVEAAMQINRTVETISVHREEMEKVDPLVCKLMTDLASSLRILKSACEEQETRFARMTYDERSEALSVFLPSMTKEVSKLLGFFNRKLAEAIDLDSLESGSKYIRLFEENIYPFLQGADLTRRSFEKPRGYAGDYEMMNHIYRNGFEGKDLLGKIIHNYAVNEETSQSVQFRKPYFMGHMEAALDLPGQKSFLSVASGPAIEVQEIVARWQQQKLDRTNFVLFDLDRMALEHAQTKIYQTAFENSKSVSLDCINASVKAFLEYQEAANESFDLIYSGGLFDYLDNLTATVLTQNLFKFVKPKGKLVIGNFTKDTKARGFLSLISQWQLIYKTEDEMRKWASDIADAKITFDYDHNKINAFIVLEKK